MGSEISMPRNATDYRAMAQGYMVDLKNKTYIDPEFGRLISIANYEILNAIIQRFSWAGKDTSKTLGKRVLGLF